MPMCIVLVLYGSYPCGGHRVTSQLVESLCCTHETNVTLCVNYTLMEKKIKLAKSMLVCQRGQNNVKKYLIDNSRNSN